MRNKNLGRAVWFKDKELSCNRGRREESFGARVVAASQISGPFITS